MTNFDHCASTFTFVPAMCVTYGLGLNLIILNVLVTDQKLPKKASQILVLIM